jgi:hypothetical protein
MKGFMAMPNATNEIESQKNGVRADIPNIAFATLIVAWVAWYCYDAWFANAAVENMILILPVSVAALILYGFVVASCFHRVIEASEKAVPRTEVENSVGRKKAVRVVGCMVLLSAFVLSGPYIGFDVSSFLFIFLMMLFLGERRIWMLAVIPLVFSTIVIYCFSHLLSTPLPVLLVGGQN